MEPSFTEVINTLIVALAVVAVIGMFAFHKVRESRDRHETIRMAIEKGQPLPEGLIRDLDKPRHHTPIHQLRNGLIIAAVGIGFLVKWLTAGGTDGNGFVGVVLTLVAGAFLFTWYLDPARKNGDRNA